LDDLFDDFGMILGSFWDDFFYDFCMILGSFWYDFGMILV
jgi:hypothetical protein